MSQSPDPHIELRGVRVHNLQGIDLDLPLGRLIVITGVSGSGKSSLAFDTLYAEGQRRYVESFSTYARRFLERFEKPDAERIEPIPPAVAVRQKGAGGSRRATVGTVTEIYDHLRLLFGRWGTVECPQCGRRVERHSPASAQRALAAFERGRRFMICFRPEVDAGGETASAGGDRAQLAARLMEGGFSRAIAGGKTISLADGQSCLPADSGLCVVVDRLAAGAGSDERTFDSLELAFRQGGGSCIVLVQAGPRAPEMQSPAAKLTVDGIEYEVLSFNARLICSGCGKEFLEPDPALFNFNSPLGACPRCRGTGEIADDAGKGRPMTRCPDCGGARLRPEALAVRVGGRTIVELTRTTAAELLERLGQLPSDVNDNAALGRDGAGQRPGRLGAGRDAVIEPIAARLTYLAAVGLGYLSLDRAIRTLSAGEAQRVRLTAALGSEFVNLLYVLDEPTTGLHPRDSQRLAELIERLRDAGNTVVIVEHDTELIRRADQVVDIGPGAGKEGGRIVFQGSPAVLADYEGSLTADFLSKRRTVTASWQGRRAPAGWLHLGGVEHHNLHDLSVDVPLGVLCVISGVSGSGKSSLVEETLFPALSASLCERAALRGKKPAGENRAALPVGSCETGRFRSLDGIEQIDDVLLVDHAPIGRSGRMNPASYLGLFAEIRNLFAGTAEAKARNFTARHFSFNSSGGGRCETCRGAGSIAVDMQFLPDVVMACPDCHGTRFRREILDAKYRGLSIAEVLALTVREAFGFFRGRTRLQKRLKILKDVGLEYVTLGQPADTLSGGEAQRLKLAAFLARGSRSRTLLIVDEPTTGLHPADVSRLLDCLAQFLAGGHSLIVIEHNLDFLRAADHVIDLGPEAGAAGGRIVAAGTPDEIASAAESITGRYLRK